MVNFLDDTIDSLPLFFGVVCGIVGIFGITTIISLNQNFSDTGVLFWFIGYAILIGISFSLLKNYLENN